MPAASWAFRPALFLGADEQAAHQAFRGARGVTYPGALLTAQMGVGDDSKLAGPR